MIELAGSNRWRGPGEIKLSFIRFGKAAFLHRADFFRTATLGGLDR